MYPNDGVTKYIQKLSLVENRFWNYNWRFRSINPKIDKDRKSAKMHFWSKLRNPNLNKGLSCGQTQDEVNLEFKVKFDIEVQGQSLLKTIQILTKVFCTSSPNLVILNSLNGWWVMARTTLGLTYRYTDRQMHATTIHYQRWKLASGKSSWLRVQPCWRHWSSNLILFIRKWPHKFNIYT